MSKHKDIVIIEAPTLTPEQEQEKWLGEAARAVKEKSMLMRGAMQQNNTGQVLRFASQMLAELRTNMLTPQHYYELYMKAFDELQQLELYFLEEVQNSRITADQLYATVQHAGNMVPRLFLLITVGSVFVKTKAAPPKDILQDLIEMARGVQNPTRGMFVRHYLSTVMKNKLPDAENEWSQNNGGTVRDSATFILRNFREMCWLWYRMETKATIHNKEKRDKERRQLCVLVGFNIVRLSQLEGIDRQMYGETVLPLVLRIILDYRDKIQQQYLLETIVRVFSDDFHLRTLEPLLEALARVVTGVDINSILSSLMDRLGNYVESLHEGEAESSGKKEEKVIRRMFSIFQTKITELVTQHNTTSFPPNAFVETLASLSRMSLKAYPGEFDRVDACFGDVGNYFSSQNVKPDEKTSEALREFLTASFDSITDPNVLLDMQNLVSVVSLLPFATRRKTALAFVSCAARSGQKITSLERVTTMFDIISPIVKDVDDTPAQRNLIYLDDPIREFVEEQHAVCKALHLLDNENLSLLAKMYSGVRKQLGQGGEERMRYTLKAMCSLYVRLALRVNKQPDCGVHAAKMFQYIHTGDGKGILEHLASQQPMEGFYSYLSTSNTADICALPEVTYDLFAAACILYEENAADSKVQQSMLSAMICSLAAMRGLPEEEYINLATKLCQHSSKLLLKADQSKMVMQCAHLFWKGHLSEEYHKKVTDCLQRALKTADNSPAGHQFALFVEALNRYLYFYANANPHVTPKVVNALVGMTLEARESQESKDTTNYAEVKRFFDSTLRFIKHKQASGEDKWLEVEL